MNRIASIQGIRQLPVILNTESRLVGPYARSHNKSYVAHAIVFRDENNKLSMMDTPHSILEGVNYVPNRKHNQPIEPGLIREHISNGFKLIRVYEQAKEFIDDYNEALDHNLTIIDVIINPQHIITAGCLRLPFYRYNYPSFISTTVFVTTAFIVVPKQLKVV